MLEIYSQIVIKTATALVPLILPVIVTYITIKLTSDLLFKN